MGVVILLIFIRRFQRAITQQVPLRIDLSSLESYVVYIVLGSHPIEASVIVI